MDSLCAEFDLKQIGEVIHRAKKVAIEYRKLTGKPLGITGEVAEFEAARVLGLGLCKARQAGYDAIRQEDESVCKIQIKGRRLGRGAKRGQRLGSIRLDREWDAVLLVLLDEDFETTEIREAQRPDVEAALLAPGSKARNERGALSVGKFRSISKRVWPGDKIFLPEEGDRL